MSLYLPDSMVGTYPLTWVVHCSIFALDLIDELYTGQGRIAMKSRKNAALKIISLFILIQLVPYGRDHENPSTVREPDWDSPRTRALAERACFDCHSNMTRWPWYSHIAPASWLVQHDVDEAREKMNFSDWNDRHPGEKANEISDHIREGEMPLKYYLLLHPEARLTDAERETLRLGLVTTVNGTGGVSSSGDDEESPGEDE